MASLSDLLATLQNNVVSTSAIAQQLLAFYNIMHPVQLYQGQLPTSVGVLYTSSSATPSQITSVNLCNTSGGSLTYYLYIVPVGSTAVAGNAIAYNVSLSAATAVLLVPNLIIPAGASLQGYSSAGGITASITGRAGL